MALVNVQMEECELLEMLLDRLSFWGREDERDLYEKMYQNYMDGGCWDGIEFDVKSIVDNDVVNYCNVITREDYPEDFDKLLKLHQDGEYDVSCEEFEKISPSFIEAVSDDEERILIRY